MRVHANAKLGPADGWRWFATLGGPGCAGGARGEGRQIEIYVSILERKALTPREFDSLEALAERIMAFQHHWQQIAEPFRLDLHTANLDALMTRLAARDNSLRLVA